MRQAAIILGAGGHGRVLLDAMLEAGEFTVLAFSDSDPGMISQSRSGIEVIGNDEFILGKYSADEVYLVNGLGSTRDTGPRRRLFERFKNRGYRFATIVHPRAIVSRGAELGEGAQVMAGAIVQPGCKIGQNAIVNTGAIIDHDCLLGAHSHIAPGVTLSGEVRVGEGAHVGTGAKVIQGVLIGDNALVGAGAVVIRDVRDGARAVGIPAREEDP